MSDANNIYVTKTKLQKVLDLVKQLSNEYALPEDWNSYEISWFLTDLCSSLEEKRIGDNNKKVWQKRLEKYENKRDILFKELGLK